VHPVAVFGQVVGLLEDEERVLAAGADDDDAGELRGIGSAAEELRPERRQGLGAVQSKVIACGVMLMTVLLAWSVVSCGRSVSTPRCGAGAHRAVDADGSFGHERAQGGEGLVEIVGRAPAWIFTGVMGSSPELQAWHFDHEFPVRG